MPSSKDASSIIYKDNDHEIRVMSSKELVDYLKQKQDRTFKYKGVQVDCMGYEKKEGYTFCIQLWGQPVLDGFYRALRKTPDRFVLPHGFSIRDFLSYQDGELYFGNTPSDWKLKSLNKKSTKTFKTHAYFIGQAKAFIDSFLAWKKQN